MEPTQLLDLMKARRSIRKFKPDPVSDDALHTILEAARWCQSASNKQPWRFIVVKNKDLIMKLTTHATYGSFLAQAPVSIAIVADTASKWYLHDTCMASHQVCLMAWALGLGTCWIGSLDRDKAGATLGLKKHEFLTTILPIGYPNESPVPTGRRKLESMVTTIE
nr:nitroreductase family protein [Candidatus Sigynarchaeota archaeon]